MSTTNNIIYNAEYSKWNDQWELIRDFIEGDKAVKSKGTLYLPKPCAHDTSEANTIRYRQYIDRAYVMGFTSRTSQALLGQAFYKPPEIQLDSNVEYLLEDTNGNGLGLTQFARKSTSENIEVSRLGVLVDFPRVEGGATKEDINNGVRPYMKLYKAEAIADWNTNKYGAITRLSSVRLLEKSPKLDDFGFETGQYYDIERILFINADGVYQQYETKREGSKAVSEEIITPLDGNGRPLTFIPFQFFGSESNSEDIDKPIMLDIAVLNKGQYRNSADDEEAVFKVGNPMLAIFTNADAEDLAGQDFSFGSNTAAVFEQDDKAELLQANPSTMAYDRMNNKVNQAQSVGARLITPSKQQTAEAARIDQGSEISVLSTINSNMSDGLTNCIDWCQIFLDGEATGNSFIALSQEFFFNKMTAQERQVWIADVQAGNIPVEDYYAALRESRLIEATRTNEEIANDLETAAPDIVFDEE